MNTHFKAGDIVRRIGESEAGKLMSVQDGYAVVDFSDDGASMRTAYLPAERLEMASRMDKQKADPKRD